MKSFEDLLDKEYGKPGSKRRSDFEFQSLLFQIGTMIKDARKDAVLTQEDLAERLQTKKSYISRLENGKCDIQLSTLYRVFEDGLSRKITITADQ